MNELHDSGKREAFESGMVRDASEDKPRPGLITPFGTERLAMHYARGAKKYDDRNWEKGAPFSRMLESLERHVIAWKQGSRSEDHLAAIAWNAFALMHYEEMIARGQLPEELDDMPKYEQKTEEKPIYFVDCSKFRPTYTMDCSVEEVSGELLPWTLTGEELPPYRVYIAGPMSGIPEFNRSAFDKARDFFIAEGWDTISPVDLDLAEDKDALLDKHGDWAGPENTTPFIRRDVAAILSCDGIAMLPGWEKSTGAAAEFMVARWAGLDILDATTGRPFERSPDVMGLGASIAEYLDEQES